MFPEKITFENLKNRTANVNNGFSHIDLMNKQLSGKKRGKRLLKISCPVKGRKLGSNLLFIKATSEFFRHIN